MISNFSFVFFNYFVRLILLIGILTFLFAFVSKRKHLLATLLRLEGLMITIFALFYYLSIFMISFKRFLIIFLTLAACEGALGLSLLIIIVRGYGRDKFNSFNFLQC